MVTMGGMKRAISETTTTTEHGAKRVSTDARNGGRKNAGNVSGIARGKRVTMGIRMKRIRSLHCIGRRRRIRYIRRRRTTGRRTWSKASNQM